MNAVSIWLERRIPIREKWSQDFDMVFRPYLISKLGEVYFHFPADVFPVLASISELFWLRAFPTIGLCNSHGEDSGVSEGEDQITRRDFTHGLVERISRPVGVPFGRPEVTALNLVAVCLILVNPPISHPKPQAELTSVRPFIRRIVTSHSF